MNVQPPFGGGLPVPTSPPSSPPFVRRPSAQARMLPPEPPTDSDREIIIGRSLTSRREGKARTSRERRIAGGLPTWDPTPPGEIVVRRGR